MTGPIVAKLQSIVLPVVGPVREARPKIPDDLGDRAADGWEGLLAIAEAAGGDWPKRTREAARALNSIGRGLDATTIGVQLLADIEVIFKEKTSDRMGSEELVLALHGIEESDWSWVNKNILARKLKPFGIKPRVVRLGDRTPRGYHLADFADAFRRYLHIGDTTATSATSQVAATRDVAAVAVVAGFRGDGQARLPCDICAGLTGHTVRCSRRSG